MSGLDLLRSRSARWAVVSAVAAASVLGAAGAWAMRVSPMVAEMTTTGAGSAARIEVGNVGSAAMPFETVITKLEFGPDGELIETPADDNFLVFPPQGVVAVGGRQVMRVQWVGEPTLQNSEAYYLWVKQLPVPTADTPPPSGGAVAVQVLYTMKALLVVAPPGAEPKVEVVSARPGRVTAAMPEVDPALTAESGPPPVPASEPGVEVVVRNTGNRYALMSGATWLIEGTTTAGQPFSRPVSANELSAAVGVGYLAPAGGVRTFNVPTGGVELDPARPIRVRFGR